MEITPTIAQTLVEYGGIVAWLANGLQRIESYVGSDNWKYVLGILLFLLVLTLLKRRRR
jgi:hypothetical protein